MMVTCVQCKAHSQYNLCKGRCKMCSGFYVRRDKNMSYEEFRIMEEKV